MITLDEANRKIEAAGLESELVEKWQALLSDLQNGGPALVAYSGGVDSSFLAYAAALALGEQMLAVTMESSVETPEAMQAAAGFARLHGIPLHRLPFDPLQIEQFRTNPPERCYTCKSHILATLWGYARQAGYQAVLDGQNDDDRHDYRPGARAVQETGTRSPLLATGLRKIDIRRLAQALELDVWDKPSAPCLATRIPYGTPVTQAALQQIAAAERYLHSQGFRVVRVRYHQAMARIEIDLAQLPRLLEIRPDLVETLQRIGFSAVTLDLQGYRMGSMNEGLSQ